ncbi:hypothetical protein NQ318_012884 [Aromia moschata]|uniref:Chondroitin sulfate proteoglycan 4 n=1 Tax=Aromia moschata TaxID=1265417 RepID=A0AAV8YBX0_9CUCU|nr:hypothetical protein NQ318_012884 [Aromia moschata]
MVRNNRRITLHEIVEGHNEECSYFTVQNIVSEVLGYNKVSARKRLRGKFFELNIHYGLFVGDNKNKNNTDIFFGHVEKFRGCISGLKYNDINVLELARHRQSQAIVQGVTWNCAAEFEATVDHPELKVQFEVKTITRDGILFYNPGHKMKPDFFLIELSNYSIRVVIKVGEKILKLLGKGMKVSDGDWHKIYFRQTSSNIELSVDGKSTSEKNIHGHLFQLSDSSYLGGLEISKRFRATQKGCSKSCDSSFKGCIRYLTVSDLKKGLPDAQVTEGLLPGCMWQYPCLQNPCSDNGICIQQGLDSFQCQCQEEFCVNVNYTERYKVFSRSSLATELELLAVEPLEVLEGQSEIITTKNLHMILDYQKYGIKDSGINFFIVEGPEHGSITIDIWPHEKNSFTLHDIARDKVHYGKFRFSLSANVVPTNDPPVLEISDGTVLRTVQKLSVLQGTKKFITPDVFKAVDPDNSPSELVYTILKSECGFFENIKKPGTKIVTFTQEDVDNGKILFFDRSSSSNTSYISLQVSDGIETSPMYKLRVSVSPQYWRLERNTGLIVLHQTSSVITPYNLSFTSNVAIPDYSAQFTIVKKPQYGIIEVEKNVNSWEVSDGFTSSDIKQHRVRYRHTNSKPDFDEFQFRTLDKTQLYTFRLTFAKCTLYKVTGRSLQLNEFWEMPISTKYLSFETKPPKALTSITYAITQPPEYGFLFSSVSKYRLKSCDTFTQEDVVSQNIKYRLYQKAYSDVEDLFSFVVLSAGCNNVTSNLTIKYSPSREEKMKVIVNLRHLEVDEGTYALIDPSHLYLEADFVSDLLYNVTRKPQHGFLQIKKGDIVKNDTTHFTSAEIKNNLLFYVHDGTETQTDFIKFIALSTHEENFQYVGQFNINIRLKNDNSPTRAIDKIFHVVVGSERLLTGKDLKYTDKDIGTPTSMIVYTCRESFNGNFYNIRNLSTKITEFTQEDLDNNMIIFKHKGPEYGKVRLWVTDGQFHVNGVLEIQASAPFIHIEMKKKIIVEQGKIVVITGDHLTYSTNLYAFDNDVVYEVTNNPVFGKMVSSKNVKDKAAVVWIIRNFTQEDISQGLVSYLNEHTGGNADEIGIRVRCKDAINVAQLGVWILPSNYWDPLEVKSLKKVSVEESTSALITKKFWSNGIVWKKNLQLNIEIIPERLYLGTNNLIVNEGGITVLSTAHIFVLTEYYKSKVNLYTIQQNVKHGCIQVHKQCIKSKAFSQKELTNGVVQYSHDGSENLEDQIILIGETGQKKSFPAILKITVLPVNDQKPKLVNNTGLVMWEGGVAVITNEMLAAVDDDRPKDTLRYQVQSCWWGSVMLTSDTSTSLNYFTQELVDKGMVVFRHQNGSEARFKFNISDGLHTTRDYLFHIKTKPVKLSLISKPLHIFPLQKKYLTSNNLLATVSDVNRKIHYEVTVPPSLGRLMMESEKMGIFKVVSSFTQDDLNNSRVFYEHTHQFSDLYANDSFVFTVRSYLAPTLTKQVLKIDISVSSGGLDAYVNVPKITVDEGGMTSIPLNLSGVVSFLEHHAGHHSPIIHASAMTPMHGQIFLHQNKSLTMFTQQQLESGQVYYEHDHSDSLGDNIHFSLYLIPGYIILCNVTVPVLVNPINDQPFNLVTPAPSLVVVQGENHTVTRHELATEDADTPPSKLRYDMISGPSNGKLVLLPELVQVSYWSQADIDDNKLVYIHEGSVLKDSFHFRIWDGKFRPQFTLFNIMVVPINITILPGLPVYLLQGSDVVFLSEKQFFIETNANKNKVQFVVKRPTRHGVLYKDNVVNPFYKEKPVNSFSYADLSGGKVMYLQTDMTNANDSFRVLGEISSGNTSFGSEVEVVIRVQPFMHIHNLTIKAGDTKRLTLYELDATPLAKLTSSNPRYTIIGVPKYGHVRKVIRSSGEKTNVLNTIVNSFYHEEVQSGLIHVAIKDMEVPWDGIQDKLTFSLAATIFQPAVGELKINIKSPLDNDISSTLPGPSDPAGHEGGLHLASPNMTRDYLLIVSMVAGVVVLGVAVIVVIKCRSLDAQINKEDQCVQPIPLPRPPDRLMSSSAPAESVANRQFRRSSLCGAAPMQVAAVITVTPLSRGELESPSPHACYPYGADEQPDDWSSIDASDIPSCPSKNIMLRRNQYWV